MYDRIWTGFDLWRSLLAVSPDKADRTSDFFLKTMLRSAAENHRKTDCGRGNSVAPGDFDQYRDSMSDAVAAERRSIRLFRFFWNALVLPDPGGTFTFCESKKVYHALKTQMRGK